MPGRRTYHPGGIRGQARLPGGRIDQVAPDVAAVQEIGPDPALARLQAKLNHKLNHKLPHATTGDPDDRRIRVAILSAHPLANITKIRPFPPGVRAVQTKDEVFDDPDTPGG
jgi:hypothetical protein